MQKIKVHFQTSQRWQLPSRKIKERSMNPVLFSETGTMDQVDAPPTADQEGCQQIWSIKNFSLMTALTAWVLAIASLVLVSVWTLDNGPVGLNHPNWRTNLFAWHPVMMVAVFFFSQVFAITTWEVFPEKPNVPSILYHFTWQCAALSGLVAGLIAVFKYNNNENNPNIISVHHWMGIVTAILYFLNFLIGLVKAIFRNSISMEFTVAHQMIGMSAFLLTVVAIGSGIMHYQGPNGCLYEGWTFTRPDYNPASNYGLLPRGCQISNGIGLTVVFSALCVMYAVAYRHLLSSQKYHNSSTERVLDPAATRGPDYIPEKTGERVIGWQEKKPDETATENVAKPATFADVVGHHGPASDKI